MKIKLAAYFILIHVIGAIGYGLRYFIYGPWDITFATWMIICLIAYLVVLVPWAILDMKKRGG